MFIRGKQKRFAPLYKMAEDGEGGGGAGGDGGDGATGEITLSEADLQAKISEAAAAAVADATRGLSSKNQELLGKLNKQKETLDRWGDLDPDSVHNVLNQFDQNEEMKLLAEGKTDEVIQRRMERVTAKFESQLETALNDSEQKDLKLKSANEKIRDLLIDSQVVSAFNSEKGLDTAVEDVVLRAKGVFSVEDTDVVARDGEGQLIRGAEGALTISEWISNLKSTAPHLFPGSGGGGAGGGAGGGGGGGDDAMISAASRGDMKTYRKLRNEQRKLANEG